MIREKLIFVLRESPLFTGFSEDSLECFLAYAEEKSFLEGEEIIAEKTCGNHLYILIEGKVEIKRKISRDSDLVLSEVLPARYVFTSEKGDFFGEMSLLDDECRSATVKACTDVLTLTVNREMFQSFCLDRPKLSYLFFRNMIRIFSHRLRRATDDMLDYAGILKHLLCILQSGDVDNYFTPEGKAYFAEYLHMDIGSQGKQE